MQGSSNRVLAVGLLAAWTWAASGCGSGDGITASKIEDAVGPTFANLVRLEQSMLGLPPIDASLLRAYAHCHKVGPGEVTRGGGNWQCTVVWAFPGNKGPLRDSYDLSVTADGCYTATTDEGHLGGPTLTTRDGTKVANVLYAFDGCFDPG